MDAPLFTARTEFHDMAEKAQKQRGKHFWKWIAGLVLITGVTLSILFFPHNRSLLEKSTKTVDMQDRYTYYHWLSDRQILFARWAEQDKQAGMYCYDIL